jgi:hypothetical protein
MGDYSAADAGASGKDEAPLALCNKPTERWGICWRQKAATWGAIEQESTVIAVIGVRGVPLPSSVMNSRRFNAVEGRPAVPSRRRDFSLWPQPARETAETRQQGWRFGLLFVNTRVAHKAGFVVAGTQKVGRAESVS